MLKKSFKASYIPEVLSLIKFGQPQSLNLDLPSLFVGSKSKRVKADIESLKLTAQKHKQQSLSSCQIGFDYNIFIIGPSKNCHIKDYTTFINPKIISKSNVYLYIFCLLFVIK